MTSKMELLQEVEQLSKQHGPWAFDIPLPHDVWTKGNLQIPQTRLRRILQIVGDLSLKPLGELRVLDLGCLDGIFSIEFAQHGARAVGIEVREANLAKARFCQRVLGLQNLEFHLGDARNISAEKYGRFDAIICSGLLYHLEATDGVKLLSTMHSMTDRMVVIDTHIALAAAEKVTVDGVDYWGSFFREHAEEATAAEKSRNLWASPDNTTSFWFTRPSLVNALQRTGFSSVYECFMPAHMNFGKSGVEHHDRCTFVAIKGEQHQITTSPIANALRETWPEASLAYTPPGRPITSPDSRPLWRIAASRFKRWLQRV